jgi:hypothetical protein
LFKIPSHVSANQSTFANGARRRSDSNRPPARCANRDVAPWRFASRARQSSVMLHARIVATSCFVVETPLLVQLRRIASFHGTSRRAAGDRALNRGQISREIMRENYVKILEKCKCECYHLRLRPRPCQFASFDSVRLARTPTIAYICPCHRLATAVHMCCDLTFDISIGYTRATLT